MDTDTRGDERQEEDPPSSPDSTTPSEIIRNERADQLQSNFLCMKELLQDITGSLGLSETGPIPSTSVDQKNTGDHDTATDQTCSRDTTQPVDQTRNRIAVQPIHQTRNRHLIQPTKIPQPSTSTESQQQKQIAAVQKLFTQLNAVGQEMDNLFQIANILTSEQQLLTAGRVTTVIKNFQHAVQAAPPQNDPVARATGVARAKIEATVDNLIHIHKVMEDPVFFTTSSEHSIPALQASRGTLHTPYSSLIIENNCLKSENQVLLHENNALKAKMVGMVDMTDMTDSKHLVSKTFYLRYTASKKEIATLQDTLQKQVDQLTGREVEVEEAHQKNESQRKENRKLKRSIQKLKTDKKKLKQENSLLIESIPEMAGVCSAVWDRARGLVDELKTVMNEGCASEQEIEDQTDVVEGPEGSGTDDAGAVGGPEGRGEGETEGHQDVGGVNEPKGSGEGSSGEHQEVGGAYGD